VPQGNLAVSNGHPADEKGQPRAPFALGCKSRFASMPYLVIARKWRPQTFDDVAGQEPITRTLQNAIRSNRIAHAFLFTGVRGVGKTTAARILAKALNCERGPTPTPCNQCTQCKEISQGSSIDVLEIDGASNRGIDEVRQIIENVRYQPAKCRFKIYIIDEVHQVTKDAFNALLKTLEEPPPSVKFILATTEPQRLPETILSRCQRYDFRRISLREIIQRLAVIAKSEGLEVSEGALVMLAREADGSMRDAQSLLEQVLAFAEPPESGGAPTRIDETLLQQILGIAERRILYDISAAVLLGDARKCVELVAETVNQGRDIGRLARDLVEHFRNLMVARLSHGDGKPDKESTGASGQLLDLPDQEIVDLTEQARPVAIDTLLDYLEFMAVGEEQIARSATPRFALESVLVRLANLPRTLPVSEWVDRLERLEAKTSPRTHAESLAPTKQAIISPRPTIVPPLGPPRSDEGSERWRDFIAFVGREKKFLASHLESAKALELAPDRVKLAAGERHHLAFLLDGDNLSNLKDLARRFFGREISVQVVGLAADDETKPAATVDAPAASPPGDRSPMVKEALRIFGGSIRNVRGDND
jgi:DNA polymerase III subunit gamma/tau